MNKYNFCLSCILLSFISLIPTISDDRCCYSIFLFSILVMIMIILACLSINPYVKIILLIFIILASKQFLTIMFKMIYNIGELYLSQEAINEKDEVQFNKNLRDRVLKIYGSSIDVQILNKHKLPTFPTIIVCNYCNDRLENLACVFVQDRMSIVSGIPFTETILQNVIRTNPKKKKFFDKVKQQIKENISEGRSVFAYVTTAPFYSTYVRKIRSGMFQIAKDLDIPVTLVTISYIDIHKIFYTNQSIKVHIGKTFKIHDVKDALIETKCYFGNILSKIN